MRPAWLTAPGPRTLLSLRIVVFVAALGPLAWLGAGFATDQLGANPIEALTHSTGEWALRFLLLSLALTPLRLLSGLAWPMRLRRMLGLYAFFYASLHLACYLWLDQFFDWPAIGRDIFKRPFITVGFAAFVLLLPLAATSFKAAIRALGGRRWQALHRSVYAIAVLSVIHFWWLVKRDIREPLIYAALLAALFAIRFISRLKAARSGL